MRQFTFLKIDNRIYVRLLIANNKSCLKGIGEVGSGEKQSITWELITGLKTDLV
ncbi:hypothetical protein O53_1569 [Microcystis aeruginosa TAIHU98]|uniref:Uncharacterized protein n=1 Tax=Microcystis aeruginosa TAIHU98 TaxID=1134457 RepID=L7EF94_MICAE|nr:hypothetical protein O53_1569 [Microcystis aeruginosa TAIHU98]